MVGVALYRCSGWVIKDEEIVEERKYCISKVLQDTRKQGSIFFGQERQIFKRRLNCNHLVPHRICSAMNRGHKCSSIWPQVVAV